MRVLTEPLRELAEFESIQKNLQQGRGTCVSLSGCVDSQKLHMVYGLGESFRCKLIVTHNERRVREIAEEFSFYDRNVMFYQKKNKKLNKKKKNENKLKKENKKKIQKQRE